MSKAFNYYVIDEPQVTFNREGAMSEQAKHPDQVVVKRLTPDANPLLLEMVYSALVEIVEVTKVNPFNMSLRVREQGKDDENYTMYRIIHEFRAWLDDQEKQA